MTSRIRSGLGRYVPSLTQRWLAGVLLVCLSGCVSPGPIPPRPPQPPAEYDLSFVVCSPTPCQAGGQPVVDATIMVGEYTGRLTTNEFGFAERVVEPGRYRIQVDKVGYESLDLTVDVARHLHRDLVMTKLAPPVTRLQIDGRHFMPRLVFVSGLTLLTKTPAERAAFLDWVQRSGFNGFRVFGGALTWANQTPDSALAALPATIAEAAQRGLYTYVVALTDSGTGYDAEAHTQAVAARCAEQVTCILEVANEIGHSTQSDQVNDLDWLEPMAKRVIPPVVPWALGAILGVDEGADYPAAGGPFSTAHLDRSRDKWNQVRRVREIAGISEGTGKPAMSGEPIGAGEQTVQGRREADPAFWLAYGALCRLFEVGCVLHSQLGLEAQPHTGNQQACAEAMLQGWRALDTQDRLTYKNAGWSDSPVKEFTGAVRVYSGVVGDRGYSVVVGKEASFAVEWQNGWSPVETLTEMPGVQVLRIRRQ